MFKNITTDVGMSNNTMIYFIIISALIWTTCAFGLEAKNSVNMANRSVIEGTLIQVSKLPPPEKNAYPDCYYTATIDVKNIITGPSVTKKIILVLPGFFARQYAPEAKYKVGERIRATVVPFASMPDKVRQTQQADETEEVDLDFYYPEKISSVEFFQNINTPAPFAGKDQKTRDTINFQQIDLKAKATRQKQMQHDLEEIDILLAQHGGNWDKWYDSLKDFRAQYKKQYDAKARKWVGDSFFSAGPFDTGKIYNSGFIKSVVAFKNYLAARNVDLILVRLPEKGEIVEDLFAPVPSDQTTNPNLLRMYKELLEADVEIITSIIPRSKAERLKYPLMYWYQDFSEFHPAEGIAWVIAEEFANRVSRYSRVQSIPKKSFTLKVEPKANFKWPEGNLKFSSADQVKFSGVMDDMLKPVKITQGYDSPVLLVGSSIMGFPSQTQGGSISQYFAYLSGIIPDQLTRAGADTMMLRNVAREGEEFLKKRTVCLFPFIPSTPYQTLASLPIIDLDKSSKTLLTTYSGPALKKEAKFTPKTPQGGFSYSSDGILNIWPAKGSSGAEGVIQIKVPDAVSKFQYFTIEIEFTSKEITYLTANYSGQTDSIIRSDTQVKDVEVFAFTTQSGEYINLNVSTKWINLINGEKPPTSIKSINFFGVSQPNYYK